MTFRLYDQPVQAQFKERDRSLAAGLHLGAIVSCNNRDRSLKLLAASALKLKYDCDQAQPPTRPQLCLYASVSSKIKLKYTLATRLSYLSLLRPSVN